MFLDLYIDTARRALVTAGGIPTTLPKLVQGDTVKLVLHGLKPNPDPESYIPYVEDPLDFTEIKCGIGTGADAAPPAGTFRVRLAGAANLVNGAPQATADLPFGVSQADFIAAINGLSTVQAVSAQGIRLDAQTPQYANFFYIRWANSAITATFEIVEDRLEPRCFVRSTVYNLPAGQLQMLKFIVAPLAFTSQFSYPALVGVGVAPVSAGTGTKDCVQAIKVPPGATGSVSIAFATNASAIIPVAGLQGALDGSSAIADALNGIYGDSFIRFTVTKQSPGVYYVQFVGPLEKTDWPLLEAAMHGQVPVNTPTALLPLGGPAIELALHGQKQIDLLFEIEVTSGQNVDTLLQIPVTILNDMIDAAMSTATDPNWIVPDDPSYPPYDPQGVTIVGYNSYVTAIGNSQGSASFIITHNLGTKNCHVTVRTVVAPVKRIPDNLYVTTYLNDDQVQIDFTNVPNFEWNAPPQPGEFEVIISSAVVANVALPHHTHPISDIVGLQEFLDALRRAGNPLDLWPNIPDTKLPAQISWYNADLSLRFALLPDVLMSLRTARLDDEFAKGGRLFAGELPYGVPYLDPTTGNTIIQYPGPPPKTVILLDSTGHIPGTVLPVDPTGWPGLVNAVLAALQAGASAPNVVTIVVDDFTLSYPPQFSLAAHCPGDDAPPAVFASIMPAVFNSPLAGSLSNGLPVPSLPAVAGKRFTVLGAANSAATVYRERQTFRNGQVIASNGLHWYAVNVIGNVGYPVEYDRELFSFYVSADMLTAGSRFDLDFTLQAQLRTHDNVRVQYVLTVELGTPRGSTGAGIGQNIYDVNWYAPIIQETLVLSSANVFHHFGYAVSRPVAGDLSATKSLYATKNLAAPSPASPGFVIRATLSLFDVEDGRLNPTGQVVLKMLKAQASVVKL